MKQRSACDHRCFIAPLLPDRSLIFRCALSVLLQWLTFAQPLLCPGDLRLTVDGTCWPIPYLRASHRYQQALRAARRCAHKLGVESEHHSSFALCFPIVRAARRAMRRELRKLPSTIVLPVRKWTH